MEDFGFKLQDIKNKNWFKKGIKIFFIFLLIIISITLLIKIIKMIFNDKEVEINNIHLVKSLSKNIKRLPDQEGGLSVDNLNVNVFNILDNKEKNRTNPIIKKTKQNIDLTNSINDNILTEQELLAKKINEINENDDELDLVASNDNIIATEKINENIEKSFVKNPKIKINSNKNKAKTNKNELKKLGNDSLIKNLKNKKDTKPGIRIQLLALKSQEGLLNYWEELKSKYTELFLDKNYYIEKVELNRSGTIYRLQVGHFLDKNSANDFCKEYLSITNKNKVDCIIIKD